VSYYAMEEHGHEYMPMAPAVLFADSISLTLKTVAS
jgi:hypothetical protein